MNYQGGLMFYETPGEKKKKLKKYGKEFRERTKYHDI